MFNMMVMINPGSGPVKEACIGNAVLNIDKFVQDCNLQGLKVKNSDVIDNGDGRYIFELERDDFPVWSCQIRMPGLPLEKVRFMDEEGQDILKFPRLFVDGSSCVWKYAIAAVESLE
jgi:hypothetical protein